LKARLRCRAFFDVQTSLQQSNYTSFARLVIEAFDC
jgi:hypothetical protein